MGGPPLRDGARHAWPLDVFRRIFRSSARRLQQAASNPHCSRTQVHHGRTAMKMSPPPFRLASSALAVAAGTVGGAMRLSHECCEPVDQPTDDDAPSTGRVRLLDLNSHLHCSVIGTCLGTPELRKLMARFIDVHGLSDLEVHHEAVRLAGIPGPTTKALHKALDMRHEAALLRYRRAQGEQPLLQMWEESLRQGEVPGAYWAVLTHRDVTSDLRQRVFGDVHMLSHLVGAANRADIRRLVALEQENQDLRVRLDKLQERNLELASERDLALSQRDASAARAAAAEQDLAVNQGPLVVADLRQQLDAQADAMALQVQRREQAETEAEAVRLESKRLRDDLERMQSRFAELTRELGAAEMQLRCPTQDADSEPNGIRMALAGKRLLYVGGRPSSTPAIRDLVDRSGGEFRKHDGGLEDRKGLLAAALAWSDLVVFPVDCIDHDSALALKRDCIRQGRRFVALRSASVSSFLSGVTANPAHEGQNGMPGNGLCVRHA